jgi:hypothetical protein
MNPADEKAPKLMPTNGQPRTNHQSKPTNDSLGSSDRFDEQLRVSVEALLHPSPSSIPAEEVDDLLLAISHHLDDETSERKAIHSRLGIIENAMKGLASQRLRYLIALCIGVGAILAWQFYGEAAKEIIATRAPELGWSPEAKQRIASWVQQSGWTMPPAVASKAAPIAQTASETLNPQQIQQIHADIAAVRQAVERHLVDVRATVEQLAATQDEMARDIEKLQAANEEILAKMQTPPPQAPAATVRKPKPVHAPSRLAPTGGLAPRP